MSSRAEQFLAAAEGMIGTRFVKHGRKPGVDRSCGLDCAGLVICSLAAIGIEPGDAEYLLRTGRDHFQLMVDSFAKVLDRVEGDWQPGDVLAIRGLDMPNHAAIYLREGLMIHSIPGSGVVMASIDYSVRENVQSVWRVR